MELNIVYRYFISYFSANKDIWQRSNILIACCNHVADIKLQFSAEEIERTFLEPIFPPPPLQNSVLIPSSWKIPSSETDNKIKHAINEKVNEAMEKLNFILSKDFLTENVGEHNDINYKVAMLEQQKIQVKYKNCL